ncbi:15743_t:CDS:2, partial [Gigaspora rosea]
DPFRAFVEWYQQQLNKNQTFFMGAAILILSVMPDNIPIGAKVYWIMLAKGTGYFSKHTRSVKVNRKEPRHLSLPNKIIISKIELPNSFIFVTSFDSENIDKNQIVEGKIIESSKKSLTMEISMYNVESKQISELNNVTMRWCIIDLNQVCDIEPDIGTDQVRAEKIKESDLENPPYSKPDDFRDLIPTDSLYPDFDEEIIEEEDIIVPIEEGIKLHGTGDRDGAFK